MHAVLLSFPNKFFVVKQQIFLANKGRILHLSDLKHQEKIIRLWTSQHCCCPANEKKLGSELLLFLKEDGWYLNLCWNIAAVLVYWCCFLRWSGFRSLSLRKWKFQANKLQFCCDWKKFGKSTGALPSAMVLLSLLGKKSISTGRLTKCEASIITSRGFFFPISFSFRQISLSRVNCVILKSKFQGGRN